MPQFYQTTVFLLLLLVALSSLPGYHGRALGSGAIYLCLPFDLLGCFVSCFLLTIWGSFLWRYSQPVWMTACATYCKVPALAGGLPLEVPSNPCSAVILQNATEDKAEILSKEIL